VNRLPGDGGRPAGADAVAVVTVDLRTGRKLTASDVFTPRHPDGRRISAFLTPGEFRLSILNGGGMGCNMDFGAPYVKIRDLLKHQFAALLPDKAKP
jgi:hypothetical protein